MLLPLPQKLSRLSKGTSKKGSGRPPNAAVEAVVVVVKGVGGSADSAKSLVTQREANRLVKAALAVYKAKLPKLIKKELRKLLK